MRTEEFFKSHYCAMCRPCKPLLLLEALENKTAPQVTKCDLSFAWCGSPAKERVKDV